MKKKKKKKKKKRRQDRKSNRKEGNLAFHAHHSTRMVIIRANHIDRTTKCPLVLGR